MAKRGKTYNAAHTKRRTKPTQRRNGVEKRAAVESLQARMKRGFLMPKSLTHGPKTSS